MKKLIANGTLIGFRGSLFSDESKTKLEEKWISSDVKAIFQNGTMELSFSWSINKYKVSGKRLKQGYYQLIIYRDGEKVGLFFPWVYTINEKGVVITGDWEGDKSENGKYEIWGKFQWDNQTLKANEANIN